jgi:glycerol-3-phosphate acyltransferase PlsY
MLIEFIAMLIGAYLLGSVPAAYIAVKWFKGEDIRNIGSGNVGSSNVAHTTSKRLAVAVGLFDMGKGALALWIAYLIGLSAIQQMAVGFMAIVGHDWPVFLHFRGGKGMITSIGIIAAVSPLLGLIILLIAYLPAIKKQMALGVVGLHWLHFLYGAGSPGIGLPHPVLEWMNSAWRSRMAYIRIACWDLPGGLSGPRAEISRDVPLGQLLFYRLFFDRDIRDRRTWIDRDLPVKD